MGAGLDVKQLKHGTNKWSRIVHVYTSMAALVIVLFFGITGITLNHPTWSIGDSVSRSTVTGTLPFPAVDNGTVDFLSISEYMRSEHGVTGAVEAFDSNGTEGSISYRKPGYQADVAFNETTDSYDLVIEQQGFLGVMNDLHKGRDAGSSWKWLIDISGLLLVSISFSGMVMQLFLRKRRRSAFAVAAVGAVTMVVLIWITLS
jgi:hypothetical protein